QAQGRVEDGTGSVDRGATRQLQDLDIPVAVFTPQEIIDKPPRDTELVSFQQPIDFSEGCIVAAGDPAVGQGWLARLGTIVGSQAQHEASGVPQLVGESLALLWQLGGELDIVAGGIAGEQAKAQRVAAVFVNQLQRVNAIAQAL